MEDSLSEITFTRLTTVAVGGKTLNTEELPAALEIREDLGIVGARMIAGHGQRIFGTGNAGDQVRAPRCEPMPNGDLLCLFTTGKWSALENAAGQMLASRSRDRGFTWETPQPAWSGSSVDPEFVPLSPKGSNAVYAFGAQIKQESSPKPGGVQENFPVGWRISTNSGHSWSEVHPIMPVNDRTFRGHLSMRSCETENGTWLLSAHTLSTNDPAPGGGYRGQDGTSRPGPISTRLYVLRSPDRGRTWQVVPAPRPSGWSLPETDRLEEGRMVSMGGRRVLMFVRSQIGCLVAFRSEDDGLSWSGPFLTGLAHSDAPPCVGLLSDGRTLIALVNNRAVQGHMTMEARGELWFALSRDGGATWSEPRFLFADAAEPLATKKGPARAGFGYCDAMVFGGRIHFFLEHQARQVLHFSASEADLMRLPTLANILK